MGKLAGRLPPEVAAAGEDAPVTMCGSAVAGVTRSDRFGAVVSTSHHEDTSHSASKTADAARAAEGEDGRKLFNPKTRTRSS